MLWKKVRNLDADITEHIVHHRYSTSLDETIFEKKSDDEIVLCLNYDGLYGINNINRFLQKNNTNSPYKMGVWTYKIGDPVLFNESDRFAPVLYNNLKGTIVQIESVDEMISHNIFYTAITRTKNMLKIYWSPESQEKIINGFEKVDISNEATIFAVQTGLKRVRNKR